MIKQAVIIAGGEGKRLKDVTGNKPKILIDVGEETLLDFQISYLKSQNISKVHFCLGIGSNDIIDSLKSLDLDYTYSIEDKPLGTYGALQNAYDYLEDEFFVLFGDIVLDYDISFGYNNFKNNNSDIHLILRYTNHPKDSDIVEVDENKNVLSINRHQGLNYPYNPLGNTAIFFSKKTSVDPLLQSNVQDIFKDFVKNKIGILNITSENSLNFIRDVGTKDRYFREIENYKMYKNKDTKYVFVDRDGTLINNRGDDNNIDKFSFRDGAIKLLKTLQELNCKVILLTNQPAIAKGFSSFEDVKKLHSHLQHELINKDLKPLDGIYLCPHHPEKGFEGEVESLKIECSCRKPKTGLVLKAISELNIQGNKFCFIGDTVADYLLAKNLNSESFIIKSELTELDKFDEFGKTIHEDFNTLEKEITKHLNQ